MRMVNWWVWVSNNLQMREYHNMNLFADMIISVHMDYSLNF